LFFFFFFFLYHVLYSFSHAPVLPKAHEYEASKPDTVKKPP